MKKIVSEESNKNAIITNLIENVSNWNRTFSSHYSENNRKQDLNDFRLIQDLIAIAVNDDRNSKVNKMNENFYSKSKFYLR